MTRESLWVLCGVQGPFRRSNPKPLVAPAPRPKKSLPPALLFLFPSAVPPPAPNPPRLHIASSVVSHSPGTVTFRTRVPSLRCSIQPYSTPVAAAAAAAAAAARATTAFVSSEPCLRLTGGDFPPLPISSHGYHQTPATMISSHSRNPSDESNSAAMAYVLEHVLQYPGSYDFPLKTMWELNRLDRAQILPKSDNVSPVTGQFAWSSAETAAMSFQASLMNQLKSLPTRTSSLPPTFINSYVSRIFCPDFSVIDWNQALTALDYLKDLETRRRKETYAAFERLGIHQETWATDMAYIAEKFPGIALWINNIEGKNKKAETFYGVIWINLRRWVSGSPWP